MKTAENPFAGQGAVLLDIGGDVGALIVHAPPDLEGVEIEIRPSGAQDHHHLHDHHHPHHPHVAVVPRPAGDRFLPTAVFPDLREGSYELYERPAGPVRLRATVRGGEVTEATWPVG